jgi:hypothetical protein
MPNSVWDPTWIRPFQYYSDSCFRYLSQIGRSRLLYKNWLLEMAIWDSWRDLYIFINNVWFHPIYNENIISRIGFCTAEIGTSCEWVTITVLRMFSKFHYDENCFRIKRDDRRVFSTTYGHRPSGSSKCRNEVNFLFDFAQALLVYANQKSKHVFGCGSFISLYYFIPR